MRIAWRATTIGLLLAGLAIAGDEGPTLKGPALLAQEVDRLCRSTQARDVAWGAYLLASHPGPSTSDWVVHLAAQVEKRRRSLQDQDVLVVRAILDAFIQRGARPDPKVLALCLLHHPSEVIVLAGQDPERYEAVLRAALSPRLHLPAWMAAASLLRARKAPGAMFQVLRGARCKLDVSVLVQKNSAIGIGGGSPGAPRPPKKKAGRTRGRPAGWPPAVHYVISDVLARGRVVLAPGSHPIVYERRELTGSSVTRIEYTAAITRNAFRYHVLADCMGWPFHEMRVSQFARKTVYWERAEDFVRKVAEKRYMLRLFWDGEIDGLVRDGYLTKAEAAELELAVPIESTWMAWGGKRELPEVPEGVLEQERERRKRKQEGR